MIFFLKGINRDLIFKEGLINNFARKTAENGGKREPLSSLHSSIAASPIVLQNSSLGSVWIFLSFLFLISLIGSVSYVEACGSTIDERGVWDGDLDTSPHSCSSVSDNSMRQQKHDVKELACRAMYLITFNC
ncbi:hypothetical protein IHE45_13G029200 [Dioscorea alata]|uniref:Uncharacterized protein n=2 Tax=Dioscorea alata TaxID=55571 RepID=A0ACB7UXD0_DIOAL|nr:hypothetical protein IHE45_13G029200 [Dioscorea alata]KAH7665362.1 hypothetical protein IHE45_13G029200 [Dioscorea alata]